MKKIFFIFTCTCVFSFTALAQNDVKKEKIKLLFSLMHQDSLISKTIDASTASMMNYMTAYFKDSLSSVTNVDYSKWMDGMMQKVTQKSKENALKMMNEDMVNIYDKYFTTEEIEDFIVFYKSTSGQKMLIKLPDITKDIMDIMMTKYMPDIQTLIQEEVTKLTDSLRQKQQ